MQLAPDGKIYINVPNVNSSYFHVIESPNEKGVACDVRQHSIQFPFKNTFSIPNMPYFRLGKREGEPCDSTIVSSNEVTTFENDIKVYPNPSTGLINIEFESPIDSEMSLMVYDVSGKLKKELFFPKSAFQQTLFLPPGIYFYSILHQKSILKKGKLVVIE